MQPQRELGTVTLTDYDEIMQVVGFGKVHWWLLFTCGFMLMLVLMEIMGMSIIATASNCDLDLDVGEKSTIQSAAFMGAILFAYVWGYYADMIGRRRILLISTSMAIVCSIISSFMNSFWTFFIMRLLTGIFIAGPSFATLTYLGEFCTHKNRPVVINYMSMFNGIAMLYCPGVADRLANQDWSLPIYGTYEYRPWRLLSFFYTLPGIVSMLMLSLLPESPKFLLSLGEDDAAFAITEWICRKNTGLDLKKDFAIHRIKPLLQRQSVFEATVRKQMWVDLVPLFEMPHVKHFLISCAIMFGLVTVAQGFGLCFTDMRNRANLVDFKDYVVLGKISANPTVCELMTLTFDNDISLDKYVCNGNLLSFTDSIVLGLTFILAYVSCGLILLIVKRKTIFMVTVFCSGVCGFSLIWVNQETMIRILFVLFVALPGVILNLLGGAVVDFIPTYLRGKAMCICMMAGRLGAVIAIHAIDHLLDNACVATFAVFATFPITCSILAYFLPLNEHFY